MAEIVCTVGPKTIPHLKDIVAKGVGLFRLNGSFGIPDIAYLRKFSHPILLDIPGRRKKGVSHNLTDEELVDLAIKREIDYIGMSYVRNAEEVKRMRDYIKEKGGNTKIVAKIETKEAVENVKEIIDASDMVLIDRGDLGTDIGFEKVPHYQKEIIRQCNEKGKKVIVATEMMMSTIKSDKPNCADVSDVYHAVQSGSDFVMLSEETAQGDEPVKTIEIMRKIIDFSKTQKNK